MTTELSAMKRLHPIVLLLFTLAMGCSGRTYKGDQRFPISGKVSFDGQPVDLGTISFIPQSDSQRVSGGMISDGAYTVIEAEGPNAGKYRVEIHWAKKTGKQHFEADLQMMVDDRKEALPPRFHQQSELTAEVSSDKTTFDFDLKSK